MEFIATTISIVVDEVFSLNDLFISLRDINHRFFTCKILLHIVELKMRLVECVIHMFDLF